jgi:hypothetical protein
VKQPLRSPVSRILLLCQVFLDVPRDSLSRRIDLALAGEEAAQEEGRPFLAWLCHRCRRRCERQIPRQECAP